MKKYFILFLFVILYMSCRYEESTYTKTFVTNNSSLSLELIPYYQGMGSNVDIKDVAPNSTLEILNNNNRGKGTGYSYPVYLIPFDSLYVVYDHSDSCVYYRENSNGTNPKAIKYDSIRSIYNVSNYVRKITQEDKRSISNEYRGVL